MDRTQEIKNKTAIYAERCCRNSYGILVRHLYDQTQHQGEHVVVDPRDGRKWATQQIHWLIKKVQTWTPLWNRHS